MPTYTGTPREFKILIDALSMPQGVTKADRGCAESLRERLQDLMCSKPPPKPVFKHIRASWPTGFTKTDKKQNWAHHAQTGRKSSKVDDSHYLNNSTTQKKIDDILEGLL